MSSPAHALGATLMLSLGLAQSCHHAPADHTVSFHTLSMDEVVPLLANAQALIVDVNGPDRYAKGHLPGAIREEFDDVKAADLPVRKDTPIVFYCANEMCSASHDAARQAVGLGYTKVFVMPAGIYGWERSGRPTERGR